MNRILLLLTVATILLALIAAHYVLYGPGRRTAELVVYGLLLLAVLTRLDVRALIRGLGLWRVVAIALVVVAMVFGQLKYVDRTFYPFVGWTMYSQSNPFPRYTRVEATWESGAVDHLPLSQLGLSSSPRAFLRTFTLEASAARALISEDEYPERLGRLVHSVADIHNRRNPDDTIREVSLQFCTVDIGTTTREVLERCDEVARFAIMDTP